MAYARRITKVSPLAHTCRPFPLAHCADVRAHPLPLVGRQKGRPVHLRAVRFRVEHRPSAGVRQEAQVLSLGAVGRLS